MSVTTKSIKERAAALAEKTADAYSSDRYASWPAVCEGLLRAGYTEPQVEAIVRSKWTRWAGDASDKRYGRSTFKDLKRWMERSMGSKLQAEVESLTRQTFGN